jgi:hypothetical protein
MSLKISGILDKLSDNNSGRIGPPLRYFLLGENSYLATSCTGEGLFSD